MCIQIDRNPLVSVIIPNFNHAKYLEQRIQSVLNQTYENFEVIILDDKSTDNSLEVINKYKDDPHVSCIVVNDENSGRPCWQWKKGIQLAKGQLIWIAESDDLCSSLFLERLVAIHTTNEVVLAFCRTQNMDENNGNLYDTYNFGISEGIMDGQDFISNHLGSGCVIVNASSVVFQKKYFINMPDEYLYLKGSADWLFWIELCRQGKVAFISETLNYFRNHHSNSTSVNTLDGTNCRADKVIIDYVYSQHLISKQAYKQRICSTINMINSMEYDSEKTKKELLDLWGWGYLYQIKQLISKVLVKAEMLLW